MYKVYFHITDAIEIYSGNLKNHDVTGAEHGPVITNYAHSPIRPFFENAIDLNSALVKDPEQTFFGKVKNNAFRGHSIFAGDLLIIDKSRSPADGSLVLCLKDRDYSVKEFSAEARPSMNGKGDESMHIGPADRDMVVGVITYQIRSR